MGTPLGDFIRARRDTTLPADLGLPDDGRRRAPGLRRTELALRADISVEYLTRIEQGRDRRPTITVLNSIADGLGLGVIERKHLYYLAKITGGACEGQRRAQQEPSRREVRRAALQTLMLLEPDGVAMVANHLGDVLVHTSAFGALLAPTGLLEVETPNLVRYVFTDARSRRVFANWPHIADTQAFDLWHAPTVAAAEWLTADLASIAGVDFTTRVHQKLPPTPEPWRVLLPNGVETRWHREVLEIPADPEQHIVIFFEADEQTRVAFASFKDQSMTRLLPVLHRRVLGG